MLTYEYVCKRCGLIFEYQQKITEAPITACPECKGDIARLVSGGAGFILKGSKPNQTGKIGSECSLEQTGKTCCGREERCGKPLCGGNP